MADVHTVRQKAGNLVGIDWGVERLATPLELAKLNASSREPGRDRAVDQSDPGSFAEAERAPPMP